MPTIQITVSQEVADRITAALSNQSNPKAPTTAKGYIKLKLQELVRNVERRVAAETAEQAVEDIEFS
jgi:hypothetical protein